MGKRETIVVRHKGGCMGALWTLILLGALAMGGCYLLGAAGCEVVRQAGESSGREKDGGEMGDQDSPPGDDSATTE